ncbi:hypothetical protein [Kaistella antarctica]|uniref:Uncharacterized protein n=1 Tax=Kaistella antarctica TaxID=266748 RepID=A0A448NR20_9FLAO|nr:hypothetical protein [Kaistella antarctica]KEY18949.1 hypothetical protein HY04_10850 [Kaistella antarctica]SEW13500.1 hypothetical protein SAMN05421765_2566 [Kaistella antarctica]VEH99195.1 Uncharacterised protein [Kaistella antarctica]
MNSEQKSKLLKGAALTGVINAVINGGIQYFFLKGHSSIPISVDSITNTTETVLGTAVMLAITLSMILTLVAYFGIKGKKAALFPTTFLLTLKHGFVTFGILTSLAVVWQKYMGTVEVSLVAALIIIGVIAGLVSGFVNYFTLKESVISEEQNR